MIDNTMNQFPKPYIKPAKKCRSLAQMPIIDFILIPGKFQDNPFIQNGHRQTCIFNQQKNLTKIYTLLVIINTFTLYLYYMNDVDCFEGHSQELYLSFGIHLWQNIMFARLLRIKYLSLSLVEKQNSSIILPVIKLFLNLVIHPVPWANQTTINMAYDDQQYNTLEFPLKLNYFILIFTLFKNILILVIKVVVIQTHYLGPSPTRVKKLFFVRSLQEIYALKCMFRQNPIKLILWLYLIGFTFFTLSFNIVESHAPVQRNFFSYFQNSIWFTFIATISVDYGDIMIHTRMAKILSIFSMLWGKFIMSCILVLLINTISLSSRQLESLSSLKRVEANLEYQHLSKLYIRKSLWRLWQNYKYEVKFLETFEQRKLRKQMQKIRRNIKRYTPTTNVALMAKLQFDKALLDIQYLLDNNTEIIKFISNHIFSEELSNLSHENESCQTIIEETIAQQQKIISKKEILHICSSKQLQKYTNLRIPYLQQLKIEDFNEEIGSNRSLQRSIYNQ